MSSKTQDARAEAYAMLVQQQEDAAVAEQILTGKRSADRDIQISPGSAAPINAAAHRSNARIPIPSSIAPWETASRGTLSNHRKELGVLETSGRIGGGPRIPTINRQPPTASTANNPWNGGNGNIPMPSSVFGSFYNDSSEDVNQLSPGFRPGSSQEDMSAFPSEDRRPSIASATTVSSNNSKSSVGRNFQKKLHGFFGDDFPGTENAKQEGTGTSTPSGSNNQITAQKARNRNNSTQNSALDVSRPISPASFSRPHTPHTSEVTPWEFQDVTNKASHSLLCAFA